MMSTTALSNAVIFVLWLVFFSSMIIFWTTTSIYRHKTPAKEVAVWWGKFVFLRWASFLSLITSSSYEEVFIDHPRVRIAYTFITGVVTLVIIVVACYTTIFDAILKGDTIRILNYGFWLCALVISFFYARQFAHRLYE
jgi:hypothetical protein